MITLIQVFSQNQIKQAKELFVEYETSLEFGLHFQDFKQELTELPGKYSPPDGRLLLAYYKNDLAGCIALKKLSDDSSEMKRLFVKPRYRRLGIGRKLIAEIISEAKKSACPVCK